jgi:hypothetical protein
MLFGYQAADDVTPPCRTSAVSLKTSSADSRSFDVAKISFPATAGDVNAPQLASGRGFGTVGEDTGIGDPQCLAIETTVGGRLADCNEGLDLAVSLEHTNAARGDVGDEQPVIGADLHAIRSRPLPWQTAEVVDYSIRPPPADMAGVRLAPHDGAIGLHDKAVREDRLREGDHNFRGSIRRKGMNVAWIRIRRVVGAGIGEDQPAIAGED